MERDGTTTKLFWSCPTLKKLCWNPTSSPARDEDPLELPFKNSWTATRLFYPRRWLCFGAFQCSTDSGVDTQLFKIIIDKENSRYVTYPLCRFHWESINTLSVTSASTRGKNYATLHFRHQWDKQPASRRLLQFLSCPGLLERKGSQGEQQHRHVSGNREHSVCQGNSPIGPSATAAYCCWSPEMRLCVAALKRPFVVKHFVVLSPTGPEHPSALPHSRNGTEKRRGEKTEVRKKGKEGERKVGKMKRDKHMAYVELTVVEGRKIWEWDLSQTVFLSLLTRCFL